LRTFRTLGRIGVALLPAAAAAQEMPEATPWMEMTLIEVSPGRVEEFLAAESARAALDQKEGSAWQSVSRTAGFGNHFRFLKLAPLERFGILDRPAAPDPEHVRLLGRIESTVAGRATYALRTTPDLDNPLPPDRVPALMLVQWVTVVPGREQDYIRVMAEDVLPHFEEANMHHSSGAITLGGDSGYVHFFHLANFAALDQGSPLARALGPEDAMEVTAKLAGLLVKSEQWLAPHQQDLRFRAEPEAEESPH